MAGYYALVTIPTRKCACMVYDTDQCHTHSNSLWCLCVLGGVGVGGVFLYLALCGLFWWDCALLGAYKTSHLG